MCIGDYNIETNNNQITNQRSVPKIQQRVGVQLSAMKRILLLCLLSTLSIILKAEGDQVFYSFSKTITLDELDLLDYADFPAGTSFELFRDEINDLGIRHQSYQQYFNGIKVQSKMIFVRSREGKLLNLNGNVMTQNAAPKTIKPKFNKLQARKTVDSEVDENNITVTIFCLGGVYYNVYKVPNPETLETFYIDVETGEVVYRESAIHSADVQAQALTRYSDWQDMTVYENEGKYFLIDEGRKIITLAANGSPRYDYYQSSDYLSTLPESILEKIIGGDKQAVTDYIVSPMMNEYINSCTSLYNSSKTFSVPMLTTITVNAANSSWWYDVWDTKIDLFFKVFNADNQLVYVSETKSDVTLPVSFILSIPIQNGYKIEFYDEDVTTNSYGGTVTISTDVPGTYSWSNANTTSGSVTISHGYSEYSDIHWGMQKTWDFYKEKLKRNSFDNKGHIIYNISFPQNDQSVFSTMPTNAFAQGNYEPYFMAYGDGDGISMNPVVSLDVMAHEFTHLVTSQNGHGGLDYMNESGALNESFSDIFAMGVKKYAYGSTNWTIGEDVMIKESFMRSMKNPNDASHPDTYGNENGFWIPSTSTPDKDKNDNGGVHTNSGVQNFWFYLLSEGGNGVNDNNNSYSVTGIGIDKALKIAYQNLINYLTPSATYADARIGSILSAQELYGTGSLEEVAVTNAWHAVGVGEKYQYKEITIKAKMPSNWGNTISAWVWEDGYNGSWETLTKEGDWYTYSKSCNKLNIIFVNGTTWNGENNQTADITITSSICCQISENKTGKRNYTIIDCEENNDTQQFLVLAQRKTGGNWFYMTADLGTAGTKRFQAIDAGTSVKEDINRTPDGEKYLWSFEDVAGGVALKNGTQYATWNAGNSAILSSTPKAFSVVDAGEDIVNISFVDGDGNTRYLSLNATEGNNYFAFYKGTTQKYNLLIIPYGGQQPDIEEPKEEFVVLAQRNVNSNWFYMTADLGTAGTKRFQAVDAGTPNKSMINTSPTDSKYIWSFEEVAGGIALVNEKQYASWKSGNSAILSTTPMALNITDISDDQVNMSFVDNEGNTRYLSLNATVGNNYFAFYKGTTQKCNLLVIPYGEKITTELETITLTETPIVQKIMRDGQLLILRDGKTYNVMGQEL